MRETFQEKNLDDLLGLNVFLMEGIFTFLNIWPFIGIKKKESLIMYYLFRIRFYF